MRIWFPVTILLLTVLTACEKKTEAPTPAPERRAAQPVAAPEALPTQLLLQGSIDPVLVETPGQALPLWRRYAKGRPALVLLSNVPYLQPIPEEMQVEAEELLLHGTDEELLRKSDQLDADPVLLPLMSLRAALRAGFFSRVVWLFPSKVGADQLDLESFRRQLLEAGLVTPDEAESFSLEGGGFKGTVAGLPLLAVHPEALPEVTEPVLLHIDLSYFQPLYKGEIKTPLYPLLVQTLSHLKERQWEVAAASICRANLAGGLPLATRFIGLDLAEMLRRPSVLTEEIPAQWDLRGRALHLENFMQKDEIRRLYRQMEKNAPDDPSVKYALYQNARQFREGDMALDYLRQAVRIDPVYAQEYLVLSDLALEKGLGEKAVQMLEFARAARPDDPHLALQLARTAINTGNYELARPLLRDLQAKPWSSLYYQDQVETINQMLQLVEAR